MVIKITKKQKKENRVEYKTDKKILTPQDIEGADIFDLFLNKEIKEIEGELRKGKVVSREGKKIDPIGAWYIIGQHINEFIKNNNIESEDKDRFWEYLYGRSSLINKTLPENAIGKSRNDFKTASLLARYPIETIRMVGPWYLWREILGCKIFLEDERILSFVITELIKSPKKRKDARLFLMGVSRRFKKIDTSVLDNEEISDSISEIK